MEGAEDTDIRIHVSHHQKDERVGISDYRKWFRGRYLRFEVL
jgi:hypothetical protein